MFWLVKFLEDVGYEGPRHFDAHAYRTEDIAGVKDFARGCMRTYVILKEKARQWNEDPEIQAIVKELTAGNRKGVRHVFQRECAKVVGRPASTATRSRKKACSMNGSINSPSNLLMGVR